MGHFANRNHKMLILLSPLFYKMLILLSPLFYKMLIWLFASMPDGMGRCVPNGRFLTFYAGKGEKFCYGLTCGGTSPAKTF